MWGYLEKYLTRSIPFFFRIKLLFEYLTENISIKVEKKVSLFFNGK